MSHPRAKLTVHGRQLLVERVLELGWTVPMAAEAQGCSSATATSGSAGSRPRDRVASGIVRVGRTGARLGSAPAERQRSPRGATPRSRARTGSPGRSGKHLRPCTGCSVGSVTTLAGSRPAHSDHRSIRARATGELVHVDVKKQGRIPAGGGWRIHGRDRRAGSRKLRGQGYDFIHAAVDDRSRLAYAEILADERKETASAFMTRALGFFLDGGGEGRARAHRQRRVLPLATLRPGPG